MVPPGVEAIVGAIRDADFGQLVMVGAGGSNAELLGDAVFAPAPIEAPAALELIASTRLALLLAEADVHALARLVARLSELALDADLAEIDLNPVLVHPAGHGVTVVDAVALTSREPITDEMLEALAAEAEAGYDPTTFRPRKG
jgi:succinyl-CoA synthetase beta subunit